MILLLDNYDSFTYNLYQFIAGVESKRGDMQKDQIDSKVKVVRNDQITPEKILELAPEALVISPGPGKPSDAGICIEAIQKLKGKIPMLGVCLGHQAMAEAFLLPAAPTLDALHHSFRIRALCFLPAAPEATASVSLSAVDQLVTTQAPVHDSSI